MKIANTARTRRGLRRAQPMLQAHLDELRDKNDYRNHGMSKADLDDFEQAIRWIEQESKDPEKKDAG